MMLLVLLVLLLSLVVVVLLVLLLLMVVVVVGVVGFVGGGGGDSCAHDNRMFESNVTIGNVNHLIPRCLRYILPSLLAALVVNGSR